MRVWAYTNTSRMIPMNLHFPKAHPGDSSAGGYQDGSSMKEMPIGPGGSLWSPYLESWLVPDGAMLRLYDHSGQVRLTQAEAEARRAQVLAEKLRSLGVDPDQLL